MAGTLRALALSAASLVGALLLGALLCVLKGEGGGLAMNVGNLSAPYVIVAVAAGLTAPRWWLGAVLGVVATELTVAGFYGTWAAYFGHEVSQSSLALWGGAGIASGAVFGIIGSAARIRRGLRYVLPALLLLEPAITEGAAPLLSRFGFGYGWGALDLPELVAYSIEIAAGLALFLPVRRHLRKHRRSNSSPSGA